MIFQAFCVSAKGWYDKKNFVISENVPNVYFIAYKKQKSIAEKLYFKFNRSYNRSNHTQLAHPSHALYYKDTCHFLESVEGL